MMAATVESTSGALDGLKIIDCDTHVTEPPDLWSSRASTSLRDRLPTMRTEDGISAWYLDGELWSGIGGNTITHANQKVLGTNMVQPFDRVGQAAWDPKARLQIMDEMGIHAAIMYPNAIGFASNHVFAIADEDLRAATLQIYNDYLVDLQTEAEGRLFPQGMLPVWDVNLTLREMERLLDKGIRGFTLTDKPEMIGLPELPDKYWDPMWDLFNESGAVVNFHIASGSRRADGQNAQLVRAGLLAGHNERVWDYFGPQRAMAISATQAYMSNVRIIVNLCMSDLFDRYPKLKIVSAESGIGWIPFVLEALEYQLDQMVTNADEVALQQRRPTEYFRDHIFVMFWFEKTAPARLLDVIGAKNVMVETDIPHPTCLYPGAREHFTEVMAGLDPDTRRLVLQDNAARLYNLPI
jgi:predicted TIM-barrel fold metal-dependent hydrolase